MSFMIDFILELIHLFVFSAELPYYFFKKPKSLDHKK